jgi:Protein of unknown function (DUF2934)
MTTHTGKPFLTRPTASAPPGRPSGSALKPAFDPSAALQKSKPAVSAEVRRLMICEAAYYLAEQRSFEVGHELNDWLAAEEQVDRALAAARVGQPPGK